MLSTGSRETIYKNGFFLSTFTLIAVVYTLLGLLGLLSQNSQDVSAFWPAKGFGLGVLILLPKKYWYAILIGVITVLLIDSNLSVPIVLVLGLSQFMAILLAYKYQFKNRYSLQRFNDSASFFQVIFGVGLALSVLSALLGIGVLAWDGVITEDYLLNLISWAVGDWVGISIITPLMLIYQRLHKQSFQDFLSIEVLLFSTIGISINIFAFQLVPGLQGIQYPLIFVPAVFSIWMGVRFGVQGAVLSNLVLASSAFASSVLSVGPYAAGYDVYVYLWLGLFILVSSITSLYVAFTQEGIHRQNKTLQRTEQQLTQTLAVADIGIWEWDLVRGKVYFDENWLNKFSQPRASNWLSNEEVKAFIAPQDYPHYVNTLKKYMNGHTDAFVCEYRTIYMGGKMVWVEANGKISCRGEQGEPLYMIGSNQDISTRKEFEKLEKHLLKSKNLESLGLMAGGVAHDFNNLLQVIIGHASLALDSVRENEALQLDLEVILESGDHAAALCQNLLAYSGGGDFSPKVINLNQIITQMGELIDVSTAKKALVKYQLNESIPDINADLSQMQQLIMNLINNAVEACEHRHGEVLVATRFEQLIENKELSLNAEELVAGDYVVMSVMDNGEGISDQIVDKIFDPFFTTKSVGRGLGMAAISGIVKAHKAGLEIFSTIDQGTTIKIYLPMGS